MRLALDLPRPAVEPGTVRAAVEEVLARREFQELTPSLAARARAWVSEQLGRLLESVAGAEQAALVGSLVLGVMAVVVVLLALRFARGVRGTPRVAQAAPGTHRRSSADWAGDAEAHERAGRRREALRCWYRSLLAALAVHGVVDETPGRTAGEYLAEVHARRPDLAGEVAAVTAAFEATWYGAAPVDEARVAEARRRVEGVRDALARVPAAAGAHGDGR